MIPRIRGKLFQFAEPKEYENKYGFEMSMWTFDGENMIGEPFTFGPFDTEVIAKTEMKIVAQKMCEVIETKEGAEPSGKFLDMKNGGVLRPWKEHS